MTSTVIPLCSGESLDLGSFVVTAVSDDRYSFCGLNKDIDKLPTVRAIGTGSTAIIVDTGAVMMYEKSEQTWYAL